MVFGGFLFYFDDFVAFVCYRGFQHVVIYARRKSYDRRFVFKRHFDVFDPSTFCRADFT